jgi:two-component system sensor histidine kinase KdpD
VHYVEVAQQAVVQMESEKLRNIAAGRDLARRAHAADALIGLAEALQRSSRRWRRAARQAARPCRRSART